jgi:hypothetical protein
MVRKNRRGLAMLTVSPVSAGPVCHRELVNVALPRFDDIPRMAVHGRRTVEAVPVDDRLLRQLVEQPDPNLFPLSNFDNGAHVAAWYRFNSAAVALASMQAVENEALKPIAEEIREKLSVVVGRATE